MTTKMSPFTVKGTRKYAQWTDVPVNRSREEIERIIRNHGCDHISFGWARISEDDPAERIAVIGWRWEGRFYKLNIVYPLLADFKYGPTGRVRTVNAHLAAYEAEKRRLWRVAAMRLKMKFELVDSDPELADEELSPMLMLPSGKTVAAHLAPELITMQVEGRMPRSLLLLPGPNEKGGESHG